jgi:hypothetical protein
MKNNFEEDKNIFPCDDCCYKYSFGKCERCKHRNKRYFNRRYCYPTTTKPMLWNNQSFTLGETK